MKSEHEKYIEFATLMAEKFKIAGGLVEAEINKCHSDDKPVLEDISANLKDVAKELGQQVRNLQSNEKFIQQNTGSIDRIENAPKAKMLKARIMHPKMTAKAIKGAYESRDDLNESFEKDKKSADDLINKGNTAMEGFKRIKKYGSAKAAGFDKGKSEVSSEEKSTFKP